MKRAEMKVVFEKLIRCTILLSRALHFDHKYYHRIQITVSRADYLKYIIWDDS